MSTETFSDPVTDKSGRLSCIIRKRLKRSGEIGEKLPALVALGSDIVYNTRRVFTKVVEDRKLCRKCLYLAR